MDFVNLNCVSHFTCRQLVNKNSIVILDICKFQDSIERTYLLLDYTLKVELKEVPLDFKFCQRFVTLMSYRRLKTLKESKKR